MLIHALSKLPIQHFYPYNTTVAFRVNLFCSLCTSMACYLQGKTALIMLSSDDSAPSAATSSSSVAGPLLGMGLFALSPLVWQYAVTAEVFALNNLFTATLLYLVVRFSSRRSMSTAYMGALVCGLALTNQHSIVLFELPLIVWMLYLLRDHIRNTRGWILLTLGGFFLLGLTPYLYLPIAASLAPRAGSWGRVDTFAGFLHHLLRRDYGTFQLFSGAKGTGGGVEGLWQRNEAYLRDLERQGFDDYGVVVVAAVVGLLFSTRQVCKYLWENAFSIDKPRKKSSTAASSTAALKKSKKNKKSVPSNGTAKRRHHRHHHHYQHHQ